MSQKTITRQLIAWKNVGDIKTVREAGRFLYKEFVYAET